LHTYQTQSCLLRTTELIHVCTVQRGAVTGYLIYLFMYSLISRPDSFFTLCWSGLIYFGRAPTLILLHEAPGDRAEHWSRERCKQLPRHNMQSVRRPTGPNRRGVPFSVYIHARLRIGDTSTRCRVAHCA